MSLGKHGDLLEAIDELQYSTIKKLLNDPEVELSRPFEENGVLPVHYAVGSNNPEVVELFLECPRVDMNIMSSSSVYCGQTRRLLIPESHPPYVATVFLPDMLELFVEKGFDINTVDMFGNSIAHNMFRLKGYISDREYEQLEDYGFDFTWKNDDGCNLLVSMQEGAIKHGTLEEDTFSMTLEALSQYIDINEPICDIDEFMYMDVAMPDGENYQTFYGLLWHYALFGTMPINRDYLLLSRKMKDRKASEMFFDPSRRVPITEKMLYEAAKNGAMLHPMEATHISTAALKYAPSNMIRLLMTTGGVLPPTIDDRSSMEYLVDHGRTRHMEVALHTYSTKQKQTSAIRSLHSKTRTPEELEELRIRIDHEREGFLNEILEGKLFNEEGDIEYTTDIDPQYDTDRNVWIPHKTSLHRDMVNFSKKTNRLYDQMLMKAYNDTENHFLSILIEERQKARKLRPMTEDDLDVEVFVQDSENEGQEAPQPSMQDPQDYYEEVDTMFDYENYYRLLHGLLPMPVDTYAPDETPPYMLAVMDEERIENIGEHAKAKYEEEQLENLMLDTMRKLKEKQFNAEDKTSERVLSQEEVDHCKNVATKKTKVLMDKLMEKGYFKDKLDNIQNDIASIKSRLGGVKKRNTITGAATRPFSTSSPVCNMNNQAANTAKLLLRYLKK